MNDPMTRPAKNRPERAWQRMLSGRRLDLLDPSPLDVEIEDIAHGLARVARWNGQTMGEHPYSVAAHSILVERLYARLNPRAPARERLTALLHDAPEYVTGDIISPFKAAIGIDYKAFEQRLAAAVHMRFSIPEPSEALARRIKHCDRLAAWFEAVRIAGFTEAEAARFFPRPKFRGAADVRPTTEPANRVKRAFLARFKALSRSGGG